MLITTYVNQTTLTPDEQFRSFQELIARQLAVGIGSFDATHTYENHNIMVVLILIIFVHKKLNKHLRDASIHKTKIENHLFFISFRVLSIKTK